MLEYTYYIGGSEASREQLYRDIALFKEAASSGIID